MKYKLSETLGGSIPLSYFIIESQGEEEICFLCSPSGRIIAPWEIYVCRKIDNSPIDPFISQLMEIIFGEEE